MCGLVGIWRHDGGEADRSAIDLMLKPIVHRGPDAMGIWQEGQVAFGHLRLSILDLTEASDEPMLTPDNMAILVYNGEVYNYREIRAELEHEGIHFRSSGDVEVVLHALHHWGPDRALKRFDGMFAFAYFDRREGTLWLARDRIGIKPLLVVDTRSELIFASEVKALLAHPRVERRIDPHAITRWLLLRGRGGQDMLFSGVEDVEPGSYWKITQRGIEKRQYFHALTSIDVDRIVTASAQDPTSFIEPFRNHLKRSIGLHLASDAPLAAMCSGGVDSSLIAAYAKEQYPGISAYVADVLCSMGEGDKAERVGQHLGIPVTRVAVDQRRFLELWPFAVWHSDMPPTEPSDTGLLAVAQACRADGIKVLLTGEGSDELFGGYSWQRTTYNQWFQMRHSKQQPFFVTGQMLDRRLSLKQVLTNAPLTTLIARTDRSLRRRLTIALDADGQLLPRYLLDLLGPVRSAADRAFLAHCICSLYHHLSWILHRHDRMGMAASIEMRVPFLENEMFDFSFHLPRRAKLRRGTGKWVVKQTAAEVLPSDIVYAPKKGFPMPYKFSSGTQQLLAGGVLSEIMEWPTRTTQEIMSWLSYDRELRFHVVGLELWARIFFNGESVTELGERLVAVATDASSGSLRPTVKQSLKPIPSTGFPHPIDSKVAAMNEGDHRDSVNDIVRVLKEKGVVCLPSFFDASITEKMREEVGALFARRPGWRYVKMRSKVLSEGRLPRLAEVFNSKFLRQIAVGYEPQCGFFERVVADYAREPGKKLTDIHFDMARSLKFMIYLSDVDKECGAFRYCLGSHLENRKFRNRHSLMGGRLREIPNVPAPSEDVPLTDMEGPAGTLIVFDTDGFHSAGSLKSGKERLLVRASIPLRGRFDKLLQLIAAVNPLQLFLPLLVPKGRGITGGTARAKHSRTHDKFSFLRTP